MKAKVLADILLQHPEFEVVTSVPEEYDDYGDISNFSDNRVLKVDSCEEIKGSMFIFFGDEKLELKEVSK